MLEPVTVAVVWIPSSPVIVLLEMTTALAAIAACANCGVFADASIPTCAAIMLLAITVAALAMPTAPDALGPLDALIARVPYATWLAVVQLIAAVIEDCVDVVTRYSLKLQAPLIDGVPVNEDVVPPIEPATGLVDPPPPPATNTIISAAFVVENEDDVADVTFDEFVPVVLADESIGLDVFAPLTPNTCIDMCVLPLNEAVTLSELSVDVVVPMNAHVAPEVVPSFSTK